MDAVAGIGRNPVSKHQIQPEYKDEQADADREILIFPDQLTTSRIGNLTRLIHTLLYVMDHTYIHTYLVLIPVLLVVSLTGKIVFFRAPRWRL